MHSSDLARDGVQPYDIRRGHQKNLHGDGLREIASECFGEAREAGGKVVCRYGALAQLTVWIDGQVLCIDTDMRKDVPDDVARSTIRAYNDFLERATGYTAKERAKKAQERAKARG